MIKATLTAAALATAVVAIPVSSANAYTPSFSFSIQTPNGSFSFGNGPGYYNPQPQAMSCWDAKQYLKAQFNHVWKVECNGSVYTFHVKNFGPVKTVKINKYTGNYWFA